MSSQINSSVYSEKKVAAYESLFKESALAKPQEVYLTITVAHLFGQAYIMEQQGTQEGDPVYARFVCSLEEISKVYINENVKASPLFIQCDTDVKGVIHRKRIIVPCLENVASIVDQIEQVRAAHMEKYEAAQEREKQKKREFLEAARMAEQLENEAKKENIHSELPKPARTPLSAQALSSGVEESFKALEAISTIKPQEPAVPKAPEKPAAPEKAEEKAAEPAPSAPVTAAPPQNEVMDEFPEIGGGVPTDAENAPAHEIPEPSEPAPAEEAKPEPAPIPEEKSEPALKVKPAHVIKPVPAPPAAPRVNPSGKAVALSEFEESVRSLKSRLDSNEISREEYTAERKRLLAGLY